MPLDRQTFKKTIYNGFYKILTSQAEKASGGDEQEDPDVTIKRISEEMATVVSDAVDTFVKGGDITVGPSEIQVVSASPGTPAVVTSVKPAKIK